MANSPELQFNVRARYEWAWGDYNPYGRCRRAISGRVLSRRPTSVNRFLYALVDHLGRSGRYWPGSWNAEIYAINLTDENTSMYTTASQFIIAEVPMRPRTMGLRVSYSFGGN